jgi:pimeloyl-ACP methyl ester carboxylesterase
LGSSEGSFDTLWARSEALAASCSQMEPTDADSPEWIGRFMNTPPVVADMVELMERHGEWREQETRKLLAGMTTSVSRSKLDTAAIRLRNQWARGQERLLYWGFSYGSILGTTFAAMQPHRVRRVVIDGVCNVPDYYRGD